MADYTFQNLSAIEFEELSRDLLQKKLSVFIESFTEGRDSGIDLRFTTTTSKDAIIQCKRYAKYSNLLNVLKKERPKIDKLQIGRYILTTSVGLTPANKTEILALFSPLISATEDILGRDDLNNLLDQFPNIQTQHYKLWFGSVAVLQMILSDEVVSRSSFSREQIVQNTRVYVPNDSYNEVLDVLHKNHYVVISGLPGIGKTTLARMIALRFLADGYSFIDVSTDIDEANRRFGKEPKQVFFYDDFLGRNFLEDGLLKNEDRRLLNFFLRVRGSSGKVLLMTTREYILSQARRKYETLDTKEIDMVRCIVDVEKYTRIVKARILYNHLFFSDIPEDHIQSVLHEKKYMAIIDHRNYNPRIIQLMTSTEIVSGVKAADFPSSFLYNLDHPDQIWSSAFNNQISRECQFALFILVLSPRFISENNLFASLSALLSRTGTFLTSAAFMQILKELQVTFINIDKDYRNKHWISFSNPSIFDFLVDVLRKDEGVQELCISSARFFGHIIDVFVPFGRKGRFEKQIPLGKHLTNVLIDVLIDSFEVLNELETKDGQWHRSRIERIAAISSAFDLKEYSKLAAFVVSEYKALRISDDTEGYDKEAIVTIAVPHRNLEWQPIEY